jgi:hypothetical protein
MATVDQAGAVERLTRLVDPEDRFTYSANELRQAQTEALNERFQDRVGRIKRLAYRKEPGTTEIRGLGDMSLIALEARTRWHIGRQNPIPDRA